MSILKFLSRLKHLPTLFHKFFEFMDWKDCQMSVFIDLSSLTKAIFSQWPVKFLHLDITVMNFDLSFDQIIQ